MPSDKISFGFRIRVFVPGIYSVKLDGVVVKDFEILHQGAHHLVVPADFECYKEHAVALRINTAPVKVTAAIDNVNVIWSEDINETRIARMIKNAGQNEIWNYTDPKATYNALNSAAGQQNRTIPLDYMLDTHHDGYINRYCRFLGDDGVVDTLTFNRAKPYIVRRPGEFEFRFRSPIFYWLLERFFQEPGNS